MLSRLLVTTAAVVITGSFALPAVAAPAPPGFKLILTSAQTAVPMGAGEIVFTIWNEGSGEAVPITVASNVPWATPAPAALLLASGTHQPVTVHLAAGARGKGVVTFSSAPGTVGTIRMVRAVASPIYVGVLPLRPAVVHPGSKGLDWIIPLVGLALAALILLQLVSLIRRRRVRR